MKAMSTWTCLLLLCGACTQNELTEYRSGLNPTTKFSESIETCDTRTYMQNGKLLRWTEDDRISLFNGSTLNRQFRFKGETGDNSGTFGMVENGVGTGSKLERNYAIYPYNEKIGISEKGVMTLTLPATQGYAPNSFGLGANTMVAVTEDVNDTYLNFKNVGGYLKLMLYGDNVTVKSITLKGNDGERIAGAATVEYPFGGVPSVRMGEETTDAITLDCGKGVTVGTTPATATAFWLVVPPTTFATGFSITVTNTSYGMLTKSTSRPLAIERNTIKPMTAIELKDFTAIPPEEVQDSLFYSTDATDFEVVAATEDDIVAFVQKDTLFYFRCLFDSCQSSRLIAYCDSLGTVERISVNNKVFDFIYHKDRSKLDILYKKNGKLDSIRDIENPFVNATTRTESGDVPFSAIHSLSHASYGIYTIINSYPLVFDENESYRYLYMKKFASTPFKSKIALDKIVAIYQKEYGQLIGNYYAEIASIVKDYATWVRGELYGKAIPMVQDYALRTGTGSVILYAMVNDVEEDKQDFKVGIILQNSERTAFSGLYNIGNFIYDYDVNRGNYGCPFKGMQTGKRYKYKPYLAPLSSSKYLEGVKCLIDYYKYGPTHTFDLLDVAAKVVNRGDDHAMIELNTKTIDHQKIKMGLYYGTDPELPKKNRNHVECDITFGDYAISNQITKTVELEDLIQDTTYYYMPYIIYDGNVLNNHIESGGITEDDHTFYGEIQSFKTQKIKILTIGDMYDKPVLNLRGYYDPEKCKPEQFGICYSTEHSEPTLYDYTLRAYEHDEGEFMVSISNAQKNKTYYYRAYLIVDGYIYYGDVMAASTEEPDEAAILGEWYMASHHLTPYVPEDNEEEFGKIPHFEIVSSLSFYSNHSCAASIEPHGIFYGRWRMLSANKICIYLEGLGEGEDDEGWIVFTIVSMTKTEMHLQIYYPGLYKFDAYYVKQQ